MNLELNAEADAANLALPAETLKRQNAAKPRNLPQNATAPTTHSHRRLPLASPPDTRGRQISFFVHMGKAGVAETITHFP
jgi:hypothetical protein